MFLMYFVCKGVPTNLINLRTSEIFFIKSVLLLCDKLKINNGATNFIVAE